jgi:prepilin-type N-terminal cleavage/methylation domain-containing protein
MPRPRAYFAYHQLAAARARRPQTAFSLLEMVVVLAIIGILVAIQLPNVIGNTDKAKFVSAQTQISNAITECATAKTSGASEQELTYRSPKFAELIPSMQTHPIGYKWDQRKHLGCIHMSLLPVDSEGNVIKKAAGLPKLHAKIASGGRIIKAAEACAPAGSLDFTEECEQWDYTAKIDNNYSTRRDLKDPNWTIKSTETPVPETPVPETPAL